MDLNRIIKCCIYSNKDKNFKANHNKWHVGETKGAVVSIVTKIRNNTKSSIY